MCVLLWRAVELEIEHLESTITNQRKEIYGVFYAKFCCDDIRIFTRPLPQQCACDLGQHWLRCLFGNSLRLSAPSRASWAHLNGICSPIRCHIKLILKLFQYIYFTVWLWTRISYRVNYWMNCESGWLKLGMLCLLRECSSFFIKTILS